MGGVTKISWCDHTFSPWIGCSKVHTGCANCYAEAMQGRMGVTWGPNGTRRRTAASTWRNVEKWNRAAECCCRKSPADFEHEPGCSQQDRPRVFPSLCDPFEQWGDMIDATGKPVYRAFPEIARPSFPEDHYRENMGHVRRDFLYLIDRCPNLDFLLLTKRPENVRRMLMPWLMDRMGAGKESPDDAWKQGIPLPNVWLLYSASDQKSLEAGLHHLLACRDLVTVLGLSLEPLVGPVDLHDSLQCPHLSSTGIDSSPIGDPAKIYRCDQCGIESVGDELIATKRLLDFVIVGGESGPRARPCYTSWISSIVRQCSHATVPCFVKQLGQNPWSGYYDDEWRDIAFDRPHTIWQPASGGHCRWDHATFGQPAPRAMISWKPKDRSGADPAEWPELLRVRQFPICKLQSIGKFIRSACQKSTIMPQ